MPIYTGVADANGDFAIPFTSNYTDGQKITVTSEKSGATKSIELFAPSDTTGIGAIQFSGNTSDFPNNIGNISIVLTGIIKSYTFYCHAMGSNIFSKATGLTLSNGITSVLELSFAFWGNAKNLNLPNTLTNIGSSAFMGWSNAVALIIPEGVLSIGSNAFTNWYSCASVLIPSTVSTIESYAFSYMSACNEVKILRITPPAIKSDTFANLKSTCIFKVPAESVDAYKAAANWSAFAARIQAI